MQEKLKEPRKILQFSLQTYQETELNKGFWNFHTKVEEKRRVGRNPATGERIRDRSKYFVHFKPGKKLKEVINEK